ncbi:MAG: hypothetical protein P8R54_22030 [Myxococcota bacterium]|nr:hypothetical protein [Myxococcota bacterium]
MTLILLSLGCIVTKEVPADAPADTGETSPAQEDCPETEPEPEDTGGPADTAEPEEVYSCLDRAFAGAILQRTEAGTYEDNGGFWDLVVDESGLWSMDIQLPMLGYGPTDGDTVDCGYTGRAAGVSLNSSDSAVRWYQGEATVYSPIAMEDSRCLSGLVSVDINFAAPQDCAEIQGVYAYDLTDYTGQGSLSMGEAYDLAEVKDDPETELPEKEKEEPDLGKGDCPIDEELIFEGSFSSVNGCLATMNLAVTFDDKGAATGTMALSKYSGNCDLLYATVSAQLSTDDKTGMVTLAGTAIGDVTAEGIAEVTTSCTYLENGSFTIAAWGDEPVAAFDLERK